MVLHLQQTLWTGPCKRWGEEVKGSGRGGGGGNDGLLWALGAVWAVTLVTLKGNTKYSDTLQIDQISVGDWETHSMLRQLQHVLAFIFYIC